MRQTTNKSKKKKEKKKIGSRDGNGQGTQTEYHLYITGNRPNLLQRPRNRLFGKERIIFQLERETKTDKSYVNNNKPHDDGREKPRRRRKKYLAKKERTVTNINPIMCYNNFNNFA